MYSLAFIVVSLAMVLAASSSLSENLEFWMTRLPPKLRALPITYLAIPGSHDSMTYTIEQNNDIGPDISEDIDFGLRLIVKPFIFDWFLTQDANVKTQLDGGIRYLDLRVATKPADDNIYYLHGLYGAEISQSLSDVNQWLEQHPNETIIVDFQHFYNFDEATHARLINQLKSTFRQKICPVYSSFENITLQWLNSHGYQVFVVYRHNITVGFWPSDLWPTPWPQTLDSTELVNFLNLGLQIRSRDAAHISQCLLTPTTDYIQENFWSSLRSNLQPVCRQVTIPWIEQHFPGRGGMNIVITDFVNDENFLFSEKVIQRNEELLH